MAVVSIHPEQIQGPWVAGFVLDRHVVKSVPIGYLGDHMQFDTTRSELGELVYQFKNRNGSSQDIVETAVAFVSDVWAGRSDCVVAAPSSVTHSSRSANAIAAGIADALGLPLIDNAVAKQETQPMKNVPQPDRAGILAQAIQSGQAAVQGRHILLIDDLWQTGSTMRRVAAVLKEMGGAEVRALAMTRTK